MVCSQGLQRREGGKERREVGCCKQSSRSWSVAKGNSWGCQKWKKLLRTEESREETTRLKGSFCEPCTPVCKSCLWCGLQHKNVFEQFILMILLGEDQRDIPTRNSLGKKKSNMRMTCICWSIWRSLQWGQSAMQESAEGYLRPAPAQHSQAELKAKFNMHP